MENRNNRQRGTGLREGWRRAPEPDRILREPRPGARRHALLLGGLGVVGAMAALLFAPQLRVPTGADSANRSISRTLYPKAPGSPVVAPVAPEKPQAVVDVPSPAPPARKSEAAPAADPADVVIREVSPGAPGRESRAGRTGTAQAVVDAKPRRAPERQAQTRDKQKRSERTASTTPRATAAPAGSEARRLARALNSRAYRLQKQGRHREAEPLLREALRHDPNYAYAQYNLGWALVEQGKGAQAIAPLRKTARQQPGRWEPKAKLAQAYQQAGRTESATRKRYRRRSTSTSTSERTTSVSQRSERSTRRAATSSTRGRTARAVTSTAGWKGSTDPKEQAFLKAWQDFKTKEEREEDERRRFIRRVSEDLVSDPR